jgi:hypothetical protein
MLAKEHTNRNREVGPSIGREVFIIFAVRIGVAIAIVQVIDDLPMVIELGKVGEELFVEATKDGNGRVHSHGCSCKGNLVLSIFGPLQGKFVSNNDSELGGRNPTCENRRTAWPHSPKLR